MPAVHGMLKDSEFLEFGNLAKSKGLSITELVTEIVKAELQKNTRCNK